MKSIRNVLNQTQQIPGVPYFAVSFSLGFGLIIFLLLSIFLPFGLNSLEGTASTLLICAGYGFIGTLVWLVSLLLLKTRKIDQLTNWQFLILVLFVQILAAMISTIYHNQLFAEPSFFKTFHWLLPSVLLTGIFPTAMIFLFFDTQLYRSILDTHATMRKDEPEETIVLCEKGSDKKVALLPEQLAYIKSAGNYLSINYYVDAVPQKAVLLRTTMKEVGDQLSVYSQIVRCHRSFLVNLYAVKKVYASSVTTWLQLYHMDDHTIPVSRSRKKALLQALEALDP